MKRSLRPIPLLCVGAAALCGDARAQEVRDLRDRPADLTLHDARALAAGDFDGDGRDEAASLLWPHPARVLRCPLHLGGALDMALRTPAFAARSDPRYAGAHWSDAAFGDVDADGAAEWVLGDRYWQEPQLDDCFGITHVLDSRRDAPDLQDIVREPALVTVRAPDLVMQGLVRSGDVSGDGIADIVALGTRGFCPDGREFGAVVSVFGRTGISGDYRNWDVLLFLATSSSGGFAVGDVTGDGIADLLVGYKYVGRGGMVHVHEGGASFRGDLTSLPPLAAIYGPSPDARFGLSLAVGDVDGDGIGDILGGAGGNGPGDVCGSDGLTGSVIVVRGGPGLAGDIDLAVTPPLAVLHPPSCGGRAGETLAALDWDGDGVEDAAFSAHDADGPGGSRPDAGEVHVVRGGPALAGEIDLAVTPPALTVIGSEPSEMLSDPVRLDWNGDGLDDLAVTSQRSGPAFDRFRSATAYVLLGRPARRDFTVLRGTADPQALSPVGLSALSPWDDAPGSASDGALYFYRLTESAGPEAILSVSRSFGGDAVRLSWEDGVPGPAVPLAPARTALHVDPGCASADGLTQVSLSVVPRDSAGDPLGRGLDVRLVPGTAAPAFPLGGFEDLGNGTYRLKLAAAQAVTATATVRIEGSSLVAPPVAFAASAPTTAVTADPAVASPGDAVRLTASVTGGVPPYEARWDVDGDGVPDYSGTEVIHRYARPGDYAAAVTVRDSTGCTDSAAVRAIVVR